MVGAGGGGALGDGADGTWLVPGDTAAFFHSVGRAPVDRHELKQMRMLVLFRQLKRHTNRVRVVKEIAARESYTLCLLLVRV